MTTTPHIVFLCGAPTSGKTTLSGVYIWNGYKMLSTDHIGTEVRFTADWVSDPEGFYSQYSIEQLLEMEKEDTLRLWPLIKQEIKLLTDEGQNVVIEGINLLPNLIDEEYGGRDDVTYEGVFLKCASKEKVLDIALTRGIWSQSVPYGDDVKPKEAEYVLRWDNYIGEQARSQGFRQVPSHR